MHKRQRFPNFTTHIKVLLLASVVVNLEPFTKNRQIFTEIRKRSLLRQDRGIMGQPVHSNRIDRRLSRVIGQDSANASTFVCSFPHTNTPYNRSYDRGIHWAIDAAQPGSPQAVPAVTSLSCPVDRGRNIK